MSTQRFNTGNPIGSNSPLDRSDNTRNLDQAVNAPQDTFQDRLGNSRLTWAGIVKAGSGDPAIAVDAADRAVDAADRAESAESSVEQNAEQIAQDAAQQAVTSVVLAVDGKVAVAQSAADRAETARDAILNSSILPASRTYTSIAEGLGDTIEGDQFWVLPNEGDALKDPALFENDGANAVLVYTLITLARFMIDEGTILGGTTNV